jgi:putative peptidoglycan lipid II flippase
MSAVTARGATVRHLVQSAGIVMVLYGLSDVLGLARNVAITYQFGTSAEIDAYFAAFRVPDFIFNLLAGGALASAFIPPFTQRLAAGDSRGGWRLAAQVINLVFVATTAICIAAALLAEPLVGYLVAPGFSHAEQQLTANLMRIMLLTPIIFGVSGIIMGILNAHQHFLLPALAPSMYNLGIIVGALALAPRWGVYGLALGVVGGALLHLGIQLPWLLREKIAYARGLGLHDADVREVVRLMAPRAVGSAAVQLNFWANVYLASSLPVGSLSALNYAFTIMLLPEAVIAQAVATVLFPTFAQLVADRQLDALRRAFSTVFRGVLFLALPSAVGLFILRVPLIQLLLQRGDFTPDSTAQTALALAFFSLGLAAHSGLEILTRVFYALHDTATPVRITLGSVILNIVLSVMLVRMLAQGGLALANSLATTAELLVLLWLLRPRLNGIDEENIARSVLKMIIASLVMGGVLVALSNGLGGTSVWVSVPVLLLAGALAYVASMWLFKSDEIALVMNLARRRGT